MEGFEQYGLVRREPEPAVGPLSKGSERASSPTREVQGGKNIWAWSWQMFVLQEVRDKETAYYNAKSHLD